MVKKIQEEMMFGIVRASTMRSLELLEMERPPSKIIKNDSLSIYESTLLKLKQGSHRNPSCNSEDSAKIDDTNCLMATDLSDEVTITADAVCSSNSSLDFQSMGSSKEQREKNMTILSFFSKCKISQHEQDSNEKEVMIIDYSSSSSS